MRMLRLPSPAIVVAAAALLVALTGTAFAAQQIVPLAKRALIADKAKVALNARRLGGQTSGALVRRAVSQASTTRGPASTAADLVVVKNQAAGQIGAGPARRSRSPVTPAR
jgi:xanthosine utilization system XapX-like protein